MHIRIPRRTFVDALTHAQEAAEKRSTTPILGCVLLQATGGVLRLTTTNKAVTLAIEVEADVLTPGEIAVDVTTLKQAADSFVEGIVDVKIADNSRVVLSAGGTTMKLSALGAADFPATPPTENARDLTMDAAGLARVLGQTVFTIAPKDNRYGLNGAHIEKVGEVVRFVSTDGNRLSWSEAPFTGELAIGRKMLMPRAALATIAKLLQAISGPVTLRFSDRACTFVAPRRTLTIRLLEADFPDYRQVLPTGFKRTAVLDRAELAAAVKATSIFATDGAHSMRFAFGADSLVLSARKLDAGDARTEVACDLRGEPVTLGVNCRFLLEVLDVISGPTIHLEIGDVLSPIVVKDPAAPACLFVVMPVRIE